MFRTVIWWSVPLGCALLEGVDDLSVLAELTDEAFLSTQTAAENMGAGELDHLGEEGGQFPINHLDGTERRRAEKRTRWTTTKTLKSKFTIQVSDQLSAPSTQTEANVTFWSDCAPLWKLVNGLTSALLHWLKWSARMQSTLALCGKLYTCLH